jgi:hypothetical protein
MVEYGKPETEICRVVFPVTTKEQAADSTEAFANCGLISAGPDLLNALETIVAAWESIPPSDQVNDEMNVDEFWEVARSAIAKAKGDGTND